MKQTTVSTCLLLLFVCSVHASARNIVRPHSRYQRQVFFPDDEEVGASNTGFTGGANSCQSPDGTSGTCTALPLCPSLMSLLDVPSPSILNHLRRSICGYEGFDPMVCCTYAAPEFLAPIFGSQGNIPAGVRPPPNPGRPNTNLLPARCGITNTTDTRIVGGEDAPPGAWPWIALLGYRDPATGKIDYLCGGALISHTHVLTAAHCVHNKQDLYSVRLGEHIINNDMDGARHQDIVIASRTSHESFNSVSFQNDIAILTLSRRVEFNSDIQPICLPFDESIRNKNFVKSLPFVAGWGSTSFNGPSSKTLREVQVPVVTQESCKNSYKNFRTVVVDDAVLCAGLARGGKDACQGDSGGPLMISENERFYLLGVVSFGYKCAEPGYPGVYTRITHYLNWISSRLH